MKLTLSQLMAVGKSHGFLTKKQRGALYDPSTGVAQNEQIGEINNESSRIIDLRKRRDEEKREKDAILLRKERRDYSKKQGTLSDLLDVYKNTPASYEQAYFSAHRKKDFTENEMKDEENKKKLSKNMEHYFSSPSAPDWHKSLSDKLKNEIEFETAMGNKSGRSHQTEAMAKAATLEAIRRKAKSEGIESDYQSAKSSHAGGSHYFKNDSGGIVRVSDHELPETNERLHNRSMGLNGRWNDEIVLHDWKEKSIPDYIHRIKTGNFPGEKE